MTHRVYVGNVHVQIKTPCQKRFPSTLMSIHRRRCCM